MKRRERAAAVSVTYAMLLGCGAGLMCGPMGCSPNAANPVADGAALGGGDVSQDVDIARVKARIDRDGDGSFDADLPIAAFTFNHVANIVPYLEAAGVDALHTRLSFDTGTGVVIPAGHPVDAFFEVLTNEEAMQAHGVLVVVQAADDAGLPEIGDVLARAGADRTVQAGETVTLDGSGSLGFVEGRGLSFLWEQSAGVAVAVETPDSAQTTFVAPAGEGEVLVTFRLMVSDGVDSDSDEVDVRVAASPPGGPAFEGPNAASGELTFQEKGCTLCHGAGADGGTGHDIRGDQTAALEALFSGGATHQGISLSEEERRNVGAWLHTLAP